MNAPAKLCLRTSRLDLVAVTGPLARAETRGRDALGAALGATVPPAWPPPLNDEVSLAWILGLVEADPEIGGWSAWYFLLRENGQRTAIGNGGFKGRPGSDGTVEIGYSILERHHRQGFAPEAAAALVDWAFTHPEVGRVIAHTLPDGRASMRVLEKCGFRHVGPGLEEGTVLFEKLRPRR